MKPKANAQRKKRKKMGGGKAPEAGGGGGGWGGSGMIEWGKNQNPQKSLEQKLTLNKSHVEFPSLKNFQKVWSDITRLFCIW